MIRRLFVISAAFLTFSCGQKLPPAPASSPSSGPAAVHWATSPTVGSFDLLAIDFVDREEGWAVGEIGPTGGAIFETSDGGKNWTPIARTLEVLNAVHFVSRSRGWVAGLAGRIERTDDGGRTWKTQRIEHGGELLNSVFFLDSQQGWISGAAGLLLRTNNGGDTWEDAHSGRVEDLWTIRFSSAKEGWIVGEDGLIVATTDGGATWTQQHSGTRIGLYGLARSRSGILIATGEKGTSLRSENGAWIQTPSGTSETLYAVSAADENVFWAVGSAGATVGSSDGGKTWTPVTPLSSRALMAIDLTGPSDGVAVGRRGVMQRLQP